MMHDAPALFQEAFGVDLLARATSDTPLSPACPLTIQLVATAVRDSNTWDTTAPANGRRVDTLPTAIGAVGGAFGLAAAVGLFFMRFRTRPKVQTLGSALLDESKYR